MATTYASGVASFTAEDDARFLVASIRDNERYNTHGIPERDLCVVFEMSHLCDWGSSFTVRRFRAALAGLDSVEYRKVGDNWFRTAVAPVGEAANTRTCAGRFCDKDITHLRAAARFCSPRCRRRR